MCGRFTTARREQMEIRFERKMLEDKGEWKPDWDVRPTTDQPAIANDQPDTIQLFRWGLLPYWAKEPETKYSMINARVESLKDKKTYKNILSQRCLVPVTGFYEWQNKQRYHFMRADKQPYALAGLHTHWEQSGYESIDSFTIITTEPNELVKNVHGRMPLVLAPEQEESWLHGDVNTPEFENILTYQIPSEELIMYPVNGPDDLKY